MADSVLFLHSAVQFCRAALRSADVQHYRASIGVALPSSPLSPVGVQTPMTSTGMHCMYGCLRVPESQAAVIALSKDFSSRQVTTLITSWSVI